MKLLRGMVTGYSVYCIFEN